MDKQIDTNPVTMYADQASAYSDFIEGSFSWKYIERPALDQHLTPIYSHSPKILDAGCGPGRVIGYLKDRGVPPSAIVGVDSSTDMLEIAQKRHPDVQFILGDIASVKLPQNSFDQIICSLVLHQLSDEKLLSSLGNFREWLKYDGKALAIVPHPVRQVYSDLSRYFNRELIADQTPWGMSLPYFHRTVTDYLKAFIGARFYFTRDSIDEPEISSEGVLDNPAEYVRYARYPSRLLINAWK